MMEEANDEQPEMVTHEEAVQAEKEATQGLPVSSVGLISPQISPQNLSAPSPLPAFLTKETTPPPFQTPAMQPNFSTSAVTPSATPTSSSTQAPQSRLVETPHIPREVKSTPQVSGQVSPSPSTAATSSSGGSGLFGWLSNSNLVNKVVEKTKSSMETVITTLDPGMKEVIYSGGEIEIAVTSTKDNKVIPVREAFQQVFGKATVTGKAAQTTMAAQPVGFTAGLKGAEERIANLRKSGSIPENQAVVSVEGFIVEILPDRWYEMSCLVLKDPSHGIDIQTFSQPTLIPTEFVLTAQDKTPADYPLRWAGLGVTIGEVIEAARPHIGHADWQLALCGVSRRDSLRLAAVGLASIYKQRLPTSFIS